MQAKDLRERATEDLLTLKETLSKDLFAYRMKNAVQQLDDTSLMRQTRRDIARIQMILHERAVAQARQAVATQEGSQS